MTAHELLRKLRAVGAVIDARAGMLPFDWEADSPSSPFTANATCLPAPSMQYFGSSA